jgi:hypothetical protein
MKIIIDRGDPRMEMNRAHWMDTGKLRLRSGLIRKLFALLEGVEVEEREFTKEEERLWVQYMGELDQLDHLNDPTRRAS